MEDQLAKLAADAVVLKEKGNKAFKAKKYDEALRLYHHAIELDVRNPALFLNRSMCYGAQGNWTLSRIDAQRAIELSPEHYTKAYCRLIKALVRVCIGNTIESRYNKYIP
jgi:DnaJ family protein C protein 7